MIYLDNAATSYPKPKCVIDKINFCLKNSCGNPGRSGHRLSLRASEEIYDAREKIANFLHFSYPERVVFTYNATYALNIAIKAFVCRKCHIITSDFEHNSVIRPLEAMKKRYDIEYSCFDTDNLLESLYKNLREDTKGIICSVASNVTGKIIPLSILSKFARENSLFLIIDASQAVGHIDIDLTKNQCDALCAPGHKSLFGVQGSGFVIFSDKTRRDTIIEGGSGAESESPAMPILLPEGYEGGTLGTPAIASLGAGIDYISRIGIKNISAHLHHLTDELYERLVDIEGIKIYGAENGIVSFNYKNISSSEIARDLDEYGICVRGGLHCAPSAHKKIGSINQGTVRASFSLFNRVRDVDALYRAMKMIVNKK